MKSEKRLVLILGGGLAGLSAAYHLKKRPSLVVEKESEVGGTARSFRVGGFTFDFTGHLLHLHTPYTRKLITRLLKGNVFKCRRNAWIYSHGVYTRYPFQANTYGLPPDVVRDCVLGFVETVENRNGHPHDASRMDFEQWCNTAFGWGISRHFMVPYNEKLYQVPASEMTTEWCGSFVPQPRLDEVIRGALADQNKAFGYNTTFLYPRRGGIQALAQALARGVPRVRTGTRLTRVDWRRRRATLSDGAVVGYEHLINTMPLPELLKAMTPLPATVERARRKLRYASILCVNVGVKRAKISDKSWIYFPEKEFPFYRVGFPMNFTPHVVPRGCSSMYVEVPFDLSRPIPKKKIARDVREGLIRCGILRRSDKLPVVQILPIRYAYVIYDRNRRKALTTIFRFLSRNSVQSIGRYGAWKYSFMEEAILDGKKAAEEIARRRSA